MVRRDRQIAIEEVNLAAHAMKMLVFTESHVCALTAYELIGTESADANKINDRRTNYRENCVLFHG